MCKCSVPFQSCSHIGYVNVNKLMLLPHLLLCTLSKTHAHRHTHTRTCTHTHTDTRTHTRARTHTETHTHTHTQAKAEDGLRVSKFLNDDLAATCAKHPKRFLGIGTVPMQDPKLAAQELRRCMTELNLAGVQIGMIVPAPPLQGLPFLFSRQTLPLSFSPHPLLVLVGLLGWLAVPVATQGRTLVS